MSGKGTPRWFKFDVSWFSNRKVLRAGRNGRDVFLAVLCMNAQRSSEGFVPIADWEPEYLAHYLGVSESDAADGMSRAVASQLLKVEGDRVLIVGWDEHWSSRGMSRAEIQKSYRERKKRYGESNAPLPSDNALPIERDRETEREKAALSLPSDWQPDESLRALAQQLACDLEHELAAFRAHHRASGHRCVDWSARFEKWLRGSRDKGKAKRKQGSTTAKPRKARMQIDGQWFVENDAGDYELEQPLTAGRDQPRSATGKGAER